MPGTPANDAALSTQQAANNASLVATDLAAGNLTGASKAAEDSKIAADAAGVAASKNGRK